MQRATKIIKAPAYSVFAPYYDEAMGDATAKINLLRGFVANYHPQARSILELACGTGTILAGFSDHFAVTGLDLSADMLAVAQTKVPTAQLFKGDMTNFALNETFDVILCIFNSINHLLKFSQWEAVFETAADHLNPGGLLIFDINTLARLDAIAQTPPSSIEIYGDTLEIALSRRRHLYDWLITITRPGSAVFCEQFSEVSFPLEQIVASLNRRFQIVATHTTQGWEGQDIVYFVARKNR